MFFTIIAISYVVFFCILSFFMLPFTYFVRKADKKKGDLMSLRFVQWGFRTVLFLGGQKITVLGNENIPTDRPVFYVGNHRSIFDIIVSYAQVPTPTGYIAKESIAKLPVISIWMKRLYCLFMKRENLKQSLQVILTSIEYLKQGISICIYPEGTRNKTEEPVQSFHAGSFKPAEKTGCPIIPMAITYSKSVFEDHLPILYRTHIVLRYGTPVETAGLTPETRKKLPGDVQNVIREMYLENLAFLEKNGSL
ncbi:MAG: 1-acyl-sn-glycerol-3-phosphate acyltransferase [Lachnospiraceae bacterium]|nr:1-acyl-sn-glycerol-3-phosphate acyltransferase [Lachnospiraceae bacterium]